MAEVKLGGDPAANKEETKRKADREKYATLQGFLDEKFEPWAVANRKTGANMVDRIKSVFSEYLDKRLDEITPWIIEKWRKKRFKQGRTVGTVNKDIATLKSCLSRAVDWGVIDAHPLRRLKLSKADSKAIVRYLSGDEERRLRGALAARDLEIKRGRESGNIWRKERGRHLLPEFFGSFGDHITPMVLLSMNTGMRRGEVFNLKWSDIDYKNQISS